MDNKSANDGMKLLKTSFAGVEFDNPVTTASGTFGSGMEYSEFVDLAKLGAVTTKGVANVPWEGNATPRIAETHSGMINAIGLQNPGIDTFIERDLSFLKESGARVIVNVCGRSVEDYLEVVERLGDEDVDMLEINISCPNVKAGGIAFGQDPKLAESVTGEIKKIAKQPVVMKLSPNVTDIAEMARAVEAGGADAVSLINTLTGMKIDVARKTFAVANKTGGMSGPCVKPVAVRMVYQVAQAVSIPILGMGGIQDTNDALEFMMAGASMVAVGTANFYNPYATSEIIDGLADYATSEHLSNISEIVGCVK
ncbi:dihydroorotate dehydrogenase [Eubacterium xylanophilum]|uniref:dihydroorotate dehydrogenase n=1 Tax=Eubacterium xylanophilum TaxID=39497 RepID=UPI0004BA4B92